VPGPTIERLSEYSKKYRMVMVIPVYEMEIDGVYYNTAAVVDADGTYLGKFRKIHIPHTWPGFWEKFYFKPGNLGFPVFETAYAKIGIYICYDRHFPECARVLALKGAEILFNPPRPENPSTCGSLNSLPRRWPTAFLSVPTIGSALKNPGNSEDSTAPVILSIPGEK
jgi:predicted amidohydrolase